MLVYVVSSNGQPLMPTTRCGKIRRLLKNKQVKVLKRCPFTVQLLYETKNVAQPISLGVDAGSKYIGLSATTKDKVLFENKEYFIFGRRASGFFDIRNLSGDRVNNGSISFRKLELVETKKYCLVERRKTAN